MRLVCITGRHYVVYQDRQVVARLYDVDHHGVSPADVEEARTASYPRR